MDTLDERVLLVWMTITLVTATAIGTFVGVVDALFVGIGVWIGPATFVGVTFTGSLYAAACYEAFRFECDCEAIYLERGVLRQVRTAVPMATVRRVDVRRGPFERLVGLRRLVVYTVGSRRATVVVPGLSVDRATTLQIRLKSVPARCEIATET